MKFLTFQTPDLAAAEAAKQYTALLTEKPNAVLGLATGGTPVALYRQLAQAYTNGKVSFSAVSTFNLDEYVGLPVDHPASYAYFMKENLFSHVDIRLNACHFPAMQPNGTLLPYDDAIAAAGGIDLQLLGIGHNGHIAFNEPGTPWESLTHKVTLAPETRRANARFFNDLSEVPTEALSMGISSILRARAIILMAFGADKAPVIARLAQGQQDLQLPASSLWQHTDVTVYLDAAAAGQM